MTDGAFGQDRESGRSSVGPWLIVGAGTALLAASIVWTYCATPLQTGDLASSHLAVGAGGHTMHMAETAQPVAGRPATNLKPVSCTPLPDMPGKALTTVVVDFPPNAFTPAHMHPGMVNAFVLSGTLRSQLAGESPVVYKAGQSWFEPTGVVHLFAENASTTEPASLLVMFIADEDCGQLVIPVKGDEAGASK